MLLRWDGGEFGAGNVGPAPSVQPGVAVERRNGTNTDPAADRGSTYDPASLRRFAGVEVLVRLRDGATWTGWLRTDLLTERSVSVYVGRHSGEGATLYIDQITEIVPMPQISAG